MNQTPTHQRQPQDATYERGQQQRGGRPTRQRPQVGRRYPTRNYLSEAVRTESISSLNRCLADTTVVRSQLKFAHWNVKGPNFYQLHRLFDELAETVDGHADAMAERAAALGGQALGTVRIAAHSSDVPALSKDATDGPAMVEQVADNLAALDAALFQEIQAAEGRNDLDTADLLNEVSRDVSQGLGFLEAHLQGQPTPSAGTGSTSTQDQPPDQ